MTRVIDRLRHTRERLGTGSVTGVRWDMVGVTIPVLSRKDANVGEPRL